MEQPWNCVCEVARNWRNKGKSRQKGDYLEAYETRVVLGSKALHTLGSEPKFPVMQKVPQALNKPTKGHETGRGAW